MSLSSRQQAFLDDLNLIEDVQERLGAIVDRARSRPPLPPIARTESNRVPGCQSQVWIVAERSPKGFKFTGDSDSPLVRGLVIFTCEFFSEEAGFGDTAVDAEADPIVKLGLQRMLSPTRLNGLAAVRRRLVELSQNA